MGAPGRLIWPPFKPIFFIYLLNIYLVGLEKNDFPLTHFSSYVRRRVWKHELTGTIFSIYSSCVLAPRTAARLARPWIRLVMTDDRRSGARTVIWSVYSGGRPTCLCSLPWPAVLWYCCFSSTMDWRFHRYYNLLYVLKYYIDV
jgi:hypothetical protein